MLKILAGLQNLITIAKLGGNTMSLLNELKLFCESEQLNSIIRQGRTIVKLTKDNIGKCSIIYGCYRFYGTDESDFFMDLENKLSILAIYANRIVYICNESIFDTFKYKHNKIPFPDGITTWEIFKKEMHEKMENVEFPKYYNTLEPSISLNDSDVQKEARRRILYSETEKKKSCVAKDSLLSDKELIKILAGISDEAEAIHSAFDRYRGSYEYRKTFEIAVQKLVDSDDTVMDYEREIAAALDGITAKTVTVEFEYGGKRAEQKIEPESIRRRMLDGYGFGSYDFVSYTGGERLMKALGINRYDEKIFAKDITRILFRGKAVYERFA